MIFGYKKNKKYTSSSTFNWNLRYYILNGIFFTLVTNLYKPFASKFLDRIGGTEFHFSLYNSLPGLVAVFAIIPGVIMISKAVNKKKMIANFTIMSRVFILSFALVPLIPNRYQPIVFVLLAGLMNFPEAVFNTAMQSFSGDIFSGAERTTAITSKNKYSQFISFIILIILGQLVKFFGTNSEKAIFVYQCFFIVAFIMCLFEIAAFYRIKENSTEESSNEGINIKKTLLELKKNTEYLKFLTCSLLFHFGWQFGWPLFSIYQIKYLHADEVWITVLGVTSGVMMFFSFNTWRKIINKRGNHFAIALATMGMAATPVLYALSRNLYVLTLSGVVMGFFTSGTITVILNSLLEVSPQKNRIIYIAVHSTLTSITLFFAPLIGSLILEKSTIYFTLFVCGGLRLLGSIAFFRRGFDKKLKST